MTGGVTVTAERRPLPGVSDPVAVYRALAQRFETRDVYLLESPSGPERDRRWAVVGFGAVLSVSVTDGVVRISGQEELADLITVHTADLLDADDRLPDRYAVWSFLRRVQSWFAPAPDFGFLAFFGYDTAHYVERLPRVISDGPGTPDICVTLHTGRVRFDLTRGTCELLTHHSRYWPDQPIEEIASTLRAAGLPPDIDTPPSAECADEIDEPAFHSNVRRALEHIAIGDIYQVQIGHELRIDSAAAPLAVYRRLRERNPSPYMYLAEFAGHTVIGASPELFVRLEGGTATMRPIAGTVALDADASAVTAATAALRADPKEIAEHVMLVDLCRNDIGRVCARGSLRVADMLVVDRYSHVAHLVSTVVGQIRDADGYDVVRALFPAGTMTGAPKIRAMEIIESLESSRRGLYAGALGLIDFDGTVNLALCIRSLLHSGTTYRTRASAGVVADSEPAKEWRETLAKLSAAYWAVTGKELAS